MSRSLYALTHVASQLIYKWLPPPRVADCSTSVDDGCEVDEPALRAIVATELAETSAALPWLSDYLLRFDPRAERLVRETIAHFQRCEREGARWLCPSDAEFPPLLRNIADPPLGLTIFGDVDLLRRPLVAVIGSRKASAEAVRNSYEMGTRLATARITVVSGGAFGCDIAAHHGVLAAGLQPAPACCVFAGGLDRLYPKANDAIFQRLRDRRAVLMSERLWGASCRAIDFHARNRLISGMAGTTLVMQAAEKSGALVTARLALDQGRDLAVLKHPEYDIRAQGSVALIHDGAFAFTDPADLMENLLRS